jgi:ribonuclease VapC
MVIDTSALTAILLQEEDARTFALAIKNDPVRLVSAVSMLETAMAVESRLGPVAGRELDLLLQKSRADVVPFDAAQAEVARAAWQKYGKGKHPARLNFGDCCAYALAKTSGEKLLFKGEDFSKTDMVRQPELE